MDSLVLVGDGMVVLVLMGLGVAVARVGVAAATIWVDVAAATVGKGLLEQADKE
ncbi:MAG: hypothetical protein IPL78_14260 [Chloroflexi bacterium]|nr:hypothetical protein [Chloroflexota bacterium]